jgi:hypothetical protein
VNEKLLADISWAGYLIAKVIITHSQHKELKIAARSFSTSTPGYLRQSVTYTGGEKSILKLSIELKKE